MVDFLLGLEMYRGEKVGGASRHGAFWWTAEIEVGAHGLASSRVLERREGFKLLSELRLGVSTVLCAERFLYMQCCVAVERRAGILAAWGQGGMGDGLQQRF